MFKSTEVIVIGAGQAGLAMSHNLSARGIDHVVLERGQVGERWHSERWPSLKLLSPNWMTKLPGLQVEGDPDAFMSASDFAGALTRYRREIDAPVVTDCDVQWLGKGGRGFKVRTSQGDWTARFVVIATGACDTPSVPDWAEALPDSVTQLTTKDYKGADQMAQGGVLVVGASATGVQLAAEIHASGRPVTLAVGRHVRAPRRYRGRDLFFWLDQSGFLSEARDPQANAAHLMSLPSLQLVGSDDNHDIDLHRLEAAGVRLAGRAIGSDGQTVRFATTLGTERAAAEARRHTLMSVIDDHIARSGQEVATDPAAWETPQPATSANDIADMPTREISTVIWATGFVRKYPWLDLPVLNGAGEIENTGGQTAVQGLFVLGLPFMRHRSSSFIYGVGRDAEAIAHRIAFGHANAKILAA